MPWKRLPNDLRKNIPGYAWPAADEDNKVRNGLSFEQARRFALKDPNINCFYICLERTTNKYQENDVVFFALDSNTVNGLVDTVQTSAHGNLYVKAGMSVAYYDPNDSDAIPLAEAGSYITRDASSAVDVVCIFAANLVRVIGGGFTALAGDSVDVAAAKESNGTIAVANENVLRLLETEQTIANLKEKGITVLLTLLNHHQNTGWSEFGPEENADASQFARQLRDIVKKYHLDGVDIDDEYSSNQDNRMDKSVANSLAMLSAKLNYEFQEEKLIVSKSLFSDAQYFGKNYPGIKGDKAFRLENELTYGFEMFYWEAPDKFLPDYAGKGMSKKKLLKGFKVEDRVEQRINDVKWLKTEGYAGFMVFNFQKQAAQRLMGDLVNTWLGEGNWN